MGVYAAEGDTKTSESQSKAKVTDVKVENKDDKADEAITNRMMRASNGSLSKFSLNTNVTYQGGSLEKPFAADRPNLLAAGDQIAVAGIDGTFNGSYRLNSLNRLNAGAGLQMLAPFNSTIDTNDPDARGDFDNNRGELDVSNPFLSWTHMNKFKGVQTIVTGTYTFYTAGAITDRGYRDAAGVSVNTMYNVGTSGFSFGALFLYTRNFFDSDRSDLLRLQLEDVYGILPQAEYVINDTFNLRTIVRSNWYQKNRATNDFVKRPVTQSVGLGISINRDIFLYPNIQFAYDDFGADRTNVGFSANINML